MKYVGRLGGRIRRGIAATAVAGLVAGGCGGGGGASGGGGGDGGGGGGDPSDCFAAAAHPAIASGVATLRHGGLDRRYVVEYPPPTVAPAPVIVVFHGVGGSAERLAANTGIGEAGAAAGYVVLLPEAVGDPPLWNADGAPDLADDLAFVDALLADVGRRLCIDRERVHAVGLSNGAGFAARLVCRAPQAFESVVMVAGATPGGCPDGVVPSTLVVHGTADDVAAFGGGGRRGLPPVPAIVAGYAADYGCDADPTVEEAAPGVERTSYFGCLGGAEVVLEAFEGGGHTWPGTRRGTGAGATEEARTFAGTDAILGFLTRQDGVAR